MGYRSPLLNLMHQAIQKASTSLLHDFREITRFQMKSYRKSAKEFVSNADLRSDEILRSELGRVKPNYGILSEESEEIPSSDGVHRWIIDPLDGTHNFLHGIPYWSISVGLEKNKVLIAGITYTPSMDMLYWGEHGQGAFCNSQRLRVSGCQNLEDALISCGFSQRGSETLAEKALALRRFGCATLELAYVAAGHFDLFWQKDLQFWDKAVGGLLVQEAGGVTRAPKGAFLASNPVLMREIQSLIPTLCD